jgi:peroxiredoxin family protein
MIATSLAEVGSLEALSSLEPTREPVPAAKSLAVISFSSEWDKMYAAFTMANAALAMGQEVHMFFTFWGAMQIREMDPSKKVKRSLIERLMGFMLPSGIRKARM